MAVAAVELLVEILVALVEMVAAVMVIVEAALEMEALKLEAVEEAVAHLVQQMAVKVEVV
jgi:hypothetical protein